MRVRFTIKIWISVFQENPTADAGDGCSSVPRYRGKLTMQDLWRQSASDLAKRIASRQVSSAEVVEAHLARIEAVNPRVNAVGEGSRERCADSRH